MGRPTAILVLHPAYQELAQTFYTHQLQLGYGAHSSRSKWRRIQEFLHFAQTHISTDLAAITPQDILHYYTSLGQRLSKNNGQPLHQKTIADYMRAIQDLYTMLQHQGYLSINPTSTLSLHYPPQESTRTALSQAEIKELYQHCHTYQEKAILALAYGCGLRVSELVQCNREDIKLREGLIVVPKGKGNKGRLVPLSPRVKEDLSNYLYQVRLAQESQDPKAFMLHSKLRRMQKGTYNRILKQLIDRTQNSTIQRKAISIHHLRHSIATHLIEQGVSLEKVRAFLGHSQLETTAVYTHISPTQLQKLVD